MRTLFREGREAEIIVYFPEATSTHSHFVAKITIRTRLDELRQQAREFFQLAPRDCHIAFKDRHGLEVYVNEVNFQRIKENIHVEKLFKVIACEPEEMTVRQTQKQDKHQEISEYKSLSRLKGIAPIRRATNADEVSMKFMGERFRQIAPVLQSWGLIQKKSVSRHRYHHVSQQMIGATLSYLSAGLATFINDQGIQFEGE